MRSLGMFVVVAVIGTTHQAKAEPEVSPASTYFFRLSLGGVAAKIRQTVTQTIFNEANFRSVEVDGSGVGGQGKLAVGWTRTPRMQLGGFVRVARVPMDVTNSIPVEMTTTHAVTATHVYLGPQISFTPTTHFYVRADVGVGKLFRGPIDGVGPDTGSFRAFALGAGAEVGYVIQLDTNALELGVALDAAWAKTGSDSDFGFASHTRVASIALVASFALGVR